MAFYVLTSPTVTTADIVVTLSGASRHAVSVIHYDGVDQVTNPVSRISYSSADSTSAQISFTSPTAAADQMLVFGINRVNAGPDTLAAPLASSNERTDVAATGGGTDTRLGVADRISSGGGDAVGWGNWVSDNQSSIGIEIDPSIPSLIINYGDHNHLAENEILTQNHNLSNNEGSHSQLCENTILAQIHIMILEDAFHSHSAPNLLIVEVITLLINETNHGHVVDNVNLLQAHALALNDSLIAHSTENLLLVDENSFPSGWGRRQKITINSAEVAGTGSHTDFTAKITLGHLAESVIDAGSNSALNGGGDIRFSSDSAGATQLACEIVNFVTNATYASRKCEIWVKIPSLSTSVDTDIYIWYNKTGETQPAVTGTYMANVISTYGISDAMANTDYTARGVTVFQLVNSNDRWWIISTMWQREGEELPIPEKLLD